MAITRLALRIMDLDVSNLVLAEYLRVQPSKLSQAALHGGPPLPRRALIPLCKVCRTTPDRILGWADETEYVELDNEIVG